MPAVERVKRDRKILRLSQDSPLPRFIIKRYTMGLDGGTTAIRYAFLGKKSLQQSI
jgi:hypothetical protein